MPHTLPDSKGSALTRSTLIISQLTHYWTDTGQSRLHSYSAQRTTGCVAGSGHHTAPKASSLPTASCAPSPALPRRLTLTAEIPVVAAPRHDQLPSPPSSSFPPPPPGTRSPCRPEHYAIATHALCKPTSLRPLQLCHIQYGHTRLKQSPTMP